MTFCQKQVELLQAVGRDRAMVLLPPPFQLWYSSHDTGCQMTIVAPQEGKQWLDVWKGSVWYSPIYEIHDRDKKPGLQPDFAFAKPVIDKYFADIQAEVEASEQDRAKRQAENTVAAEDQKRRAIEAVRTAIGA